MESNTEFGIHWYSFTTRASITDLFRVLTPLLCPSIDESEWQSAWQERPIGQFNYRRSILGPANARILYSPGRSDVHVELKGTACECMGLEGLLKLMTSDLIQAAKRIDFAFDGIIGPNEKQLSPNWVYDLCRSSPDEVRTKANIKPDLNLPPEKRSRSLEFHENAQGATCYVGASSSERRLRIYDRRGPTRLELQLRHKRAADALMCMEGKRGDQVKRTALSLLRDYINFVIPEGKNKTRFKCQDWWTAFCDGVETMKIAHSRPEPTIEQKCRFIATQISSTDCLLVDKFQEASVDEDGAINLSRDQAWVEYGRLKDSRPRSASSILAAVVNRQVFGLYEATKIFKFEKRDPASFTDGLSDVPVEDQPKKDGPQTPD